ncbi:hypothetical protein E5554_00595 [Sphingobium sp. PAMC28499]|uniref:hypothetical protein n=1 Tax=Sphingobium sp. PAMC28499 TaxID=2565554 RepID=UPI00109E139B|nr:hypothetical protein [Sphingobium sp. PAMC28499]QCB36479.1 hypothetical protein E5554_00595 [Sphingobium sp. PAMC28499]
MIGNRTRWMTGALVGAGLLLGSVAPAQARPRYDDRYWHHRHDRGNGFGFGDAVGIAALLGAAVVVANSVSKDRKDARGADADNRPYADNDAPPPTGGTDYGADAGNGDVYSPESSARADDFSDVAATNQSNDQLTDACALAARDEAQGQAGYAEIRHIDEPRATADSYNIDGEVETRASYRATEGTTRRFTCAMKDGRVAEVYLSRDVAMH